MQSKVSVTLLQGDIHRRESQEQIGVHTNVSQKQGYHGQGKMYGYEKISWSGIFSPGNLEKIKKT